MQAFLLGFCSSGYDFAIASSRHHLTVITLQVAMRFVGNYALRGLSPQTDGMPVIPKKAGQQLCPAFHDLIKFYFIHLLALLYFYIKLKIKLLQFRCLCFLLLLQAIQDLPQYLMPPAQSSPFQTMITESFHKVHLLFPSREEHLEHLQEVP